MRQLHEKIQQERVKATPINYRALAINQSGELTERESLLDQRIVEGYSVIWGSRNMHGEKFVKGAFAKSIRENGPNSGATYEIKFTNRHGNALARFSELREDNIGLYFRTLPLDNITAGDEVIEQIRTGTLNNFSVGFNPIWDKAEWEEDTSTLVYKEVALFEMGVVDIPSDLQTYAIRSAFSDNDIADQTELFIKTLPKERQLEARKLFSLQRSLTIEPPKHSETIEPTIDYNYLVKTLNS